MRNLHILDTSTAPNYRAMKRVFTSVAENAQQYITFLTIAHLAKPLGLTRSKKISL